MPRTVLVVDDNNINRHILKNILVSSYNVEEAKDGVEALSLIKKMGGDISAVMLDLVMPEMDGYQVLEQLRNDPVLSPIPVIVTTASTDDGTEIKALGLGAKDFIVKPYNPEIILRRLQNLIQLRESASLIETLQRDRVTGLYSRETFFHKASLLIADKPEGYYCLSSIDINGFKLINDRYGTTKGNEVLLGVARVIEKDCESNGGLCGRVSADNFVTLYPYDLMLGNDVQRRMRESEMINSLGIPVTLRIGRYIVVNKALTLSSMYDKAVIANETIKDRYDTRVALYDEIMHDRIVREQEIINEMKSALYGGQFEAWFQPQYNHATGALVGAEALARWRHPRWGMVSPAEFIPVFERNGFVYRLDKYIWELSCAQIRKFIDEGREPLPISVNISRHDLFKEDLVNVIVALTEKYGVRPGLLRLEITESAFTESTEQVVNMVRQLVAKGFTVEIDDFGSGYSSLNMLKEVPAQVLKLDMRFLRNGGDSERGGNILQSVIRMAELIGMSVIAEGVETASQADFLKSVGCNYIQGYLYSRPLPPAELEKLSREADVERRLISIEPVRNLDSNAFWDPESLDTLVFNSYVGAACISEFRDDSFLLVRANDRFASALSSKTLTVSDILRIDWKNHISAQDLKIIHDSVERSAQTGDEVECEFVLNDLPGNPGKVYISDTLRVIASTMKRYLVYNIIVNITLRKKAEENERDAEERFRIAMNMSELIMGQYDIRNSVFSHEDKKLLSLGFKPVLNDVPRSLFESGIVSSGQEETVNDFIDNLRKGESPCHTETLLRMRENEYRWCSIDATVVRDSDNVPSKAVIVIKDVSEQREKESFYTKWQQSLSGKQSGNYTFIRWNLNNNGPYSIREGGLIESEMPDDTPAIVRIADYAARRVHPDDRNEFIALMNAESLTLSYHHGIREHAMEFREVKDNGDEKWRSLTVELVEHPFSDEIEAYMMVENIDEKKKNDLLVHEQAETDPLTGVLNRNSFSLKASLAKYNNISNENFVLMVLDIDGFKLLNDTFGHAAGDQMLIDTANTLRSILRPTDLIGRLGGDEFFIGLRNMYNYNDIENKAKQICALMRKTYSVDVQLSASIGIAMCPRDGSSFEEVYRKADSALYSVKTSGRDSYAFYRPSMDKNGERTADDTGALRQERKPTEYKRRMLIVTGNDDDAEHISSLFRGNYKIERVSDGNSALARMRHYGTAISVVLLDFSLQGMNGFELLGQMRSSAHTQSVPAIVINENDDRETEMRVIRCGGTDFVTKPVDDDLLKARVISAVSKAENERLRAQNSFLSLQSDTLLKYRTALESMATFIVEYNLKTGSYAYDPSITKYIAGEYDDRRLWHILLSDMVADVKDVQTMQTLVHKVAGDRTQYKAHVTVTLRTPSKEKHRFRLNIVKIENENRQADRIILSFTDLDDGNQAQEGGK